MGSTEIVGGEPLWRCAKCERKISMEMLRNHGDNPGRLLCPWCFYREGKGD